ncbi:DNRLRE domain-containing protein [Paenibacillus sp. YN15]|uniref:CBM96 family carbohydrate-binding protein n=1 Tax=Paenibacillus sp. YN15 TaxID=1742774 RepID=UPI000DCB06C3|nr:DNRLRE domain-containing protein [Paenibacillus sp. YN15]RAU96384.1 hypothetical protein DQG13_20745 [Paenibacillus sp. YN15]
MIFIPNKRIRKATAVFLTIVMMLGALFGSGLPVGLQAKTAHAASTQPVKLISAEDAYVRGGKYIDNNYGKELNLYFVNDPNDDGKRKSFLKFNYSDVESVYSAKLRVYGKLDSTVIPSVTLMVYGVDTNEWSELTITWRNAPSPSGEPLGSQTVTSTAQYFEFDVTDYLQSKLGGEQIASFVLMNGTQTEKEARVLSRENTIKPELVIIEQMPEIPAEYIVDNKDSGFTTSGGTWPSSTTLGGYYGDDLVHDGTATADSPDKWAKWTPYILKAGDYDIYMRWVAFNNRPKAAPIEVKYDGGTDTTKTVNQQVNNGTWMKIGRYHLSEGSDNYVKILATDAGYTVADAVKFVYIDTTPKPPEIPTTDVVEIANLGQGNTGNIRVLEYEVTPSIANIDAAITVTGHAAVPQDREDFPVAVRLNANGVFDAVNGDRYMAERTVAYSVYETYHVKTVVNLVADTFDAWVAAPDSPLVQIAKDYSFAAAAPEIADIGKLYKQTNGNGIAAVENVNLIGSSHESAISFNDAVHSLGSDTAGDKAIRFDVLPVTSVGNEIIGFAGENASIYGYADLAMILRISAGTFDAYNRIGYASENELRASVGTKYHVKLVPDFTAKTYSVWVAPEGKSPVQIADSYAFRSTSSPDINSLSQMLVKTEDSGVFRVSNVLVLDQAEQAAAIQAVNNATTPSEMKRALTSNALGLSLDKFQTMTAAEQDKLAKDLLAGIPYASDMEIQLAFDDPVLVQDDLEPPTAPGSLTATAVPSQQVRLSWTESTDDVGIKHYKVFRDGNEIATVASGTVYVDSDVRPSTSYSYMVKAYDFALKEASSEPVAVTTLSEDELIDFPFDSSVVNSMFNQILAKYSLTPSTIENPNTHQNYMTMTEYDPNRLKSAYAMYYLTMASMYNPDYMAADGTKVYERALAQIRNVIAGGNEPAMSGNGLNATGYLPVLNTMTLAKLQVPAVWERLTEEEKHKIDLLMEAALIGAHWGYSDKNNFNTGLDQIGNFGKDWNPNYRNGGVGSAIATIYYFGVEAANSRLKNFSYDSFAAELQAAGLTNIATTFANTGKTKLEQATKNDGEAGFTYKGHRPDQLGLWMKELMDYGFNGTVSPFGGYEVPVSPTYPYGYQGFILGGFDEFPNLGARGMALEFDATDGGGSRTSLGYVYAGWQSIIHIIYDVQSFSGGSTGLSDSQMADIVSRMGVATTDMLYKEAYGYNDYHKGLNRGTYSIAGSYGDSFAANKELWLKIIDNPAQAVQAVNAASSAGELKEAVLSGDLALVLFGYNALSESARQAVIETLYSGRPAKGYANKTVVQQALYDAVKTEGIKALNSAANAGEWMAALKSAALGLYLPEYGALSPAQQEAAAQLMIDLKPAGGYASKAAIRAAAKEAAETINAPERPQLKNLPPVAEGNSRIDVADFAAWPEYHGDAKVALWNDDKAGAFSITIDDNYNSQHSTWKQFSEQYGFHFTWFVITGGTGGDRAFTREVWEPLIAAGHDIQSHTVNHEDLRDTANYPEQKYIDEYLGSLQMINQLAGGNAKTLDYPFGNGNQEVAARYYIAARGVQGLPNQAGNVNYLQVSSFSSVPSAKIAYTGPNDASVEGLVKTLYDPNYKVSNVSYYGGWTSVHYHSLLESAYNSSTGTTLTAKDIAQNMLGYLDASRDRVWVGTFTDVAMYAQERDTHQLKVTAKDSNRIKFTLTDQMDDTLFDYPLTVRVRVSNDWNGVKATQKGMEIPATELYVGDNKYVLVKAVPDKGEVVLTPLAVEPGPDTVAPVWPEASQVASSDVTPHSVALSWTPAEDNIGVAQYRISWGESRSVTVAGSASTAVITDLSPAIAYIFKVEAGDGAGNWTTDGPSVEVLTLPEDQGGGNPGGGDDGGNPGGGDDGSNPGGDDGSTPGGSDDGGTSGSGGSGESSPSGHAPVVLQGNQAVVELATGQTDVSILLTDIQSRPLSVLADRAKITVDQAALSRLLAKLDSIENAAINVKIAPVHDSAVVNSPVRGGTAAVRSAGQVLDFSITLTAKDGSQIPVEQAAGGAEIILPYSEGMDEELLGAYYYNEQSKEWEYAGGKVDPLKRQVSVRLEHLGTYAALEYNKEFADIPFDHWASRTLQVLAAKHIVTGVTDSQFMPDKRTTRAEFTALLVRTLGLQADGKAAVFADVSSDSWYAREVEAASAAGLVTGVTESLFEPDAYLTREQMAVLLTRAYEYLQGRSIAAANHELDGYKDRADVSEWALEQVNKAVSAGLMGGKGADEFDPKTDTTRVESAQGILNLLKAK